MKSEIRAPIPTPLFLCFVSEGMLGSVKDSAQQPMQLLEILREQDFRSRDWECDSTVIAIAIDIDNRSFTQVKQAQWFQRDARRRAILFLHVELIRSIPFTDLGYTTVSESLDHTFLPLPGHCLGMAFSNLYYNFKLQKFCNAKNLNKTECDQVCKYCKQNLLTMFFIRYNSYKIHPFKVYSLVFGIFIHEVVQPSLLSNSSTLSSPQKETLYPNSHPTFPSPWQSVIYFQSPWICLDISGHFLFMAE